MSFWFQPIKQNVSDAYSEADLQRIGDVLKEWFCAGVEVKPLEQGVGVHWHGFTDPQGQLICAVSDKSALLEGLLGCPLDSDTERKPPVIQLLTRFIATIAKEVTGFVGDVEDLTTRLRPIDEVIELDSQLDCTLVLALRTASGRYFQLLFLPGALHYPVVTKASQPLPDQQSIVAKLADYLTGATVNKTLYFPAQQVLDLKLGDVLISGTTTNNTFELKIVDETVCEVSIAQHGPCKVAIVK